MLLKSYFLGDNLGEVMQSVDDLLM
jgi:hypothetical protein